MDNKNTLSYHLSYLKTINAQFKTIKPNAVIGLNCRSRLSSAAVYTSTTTAKNCKYLPGETQFSRIAAFQVYYLLGITHF
jgi:hypothetical protein